MNTKQILDTNKSALIRHSFNQAYGLNNTSLINKVEPSVVQYILTTNSILDLSLNTFRFKKHVTKTAFKTNFCQGLVGNCDIQTVQIALHYSSGISNNKTRMIASISASPDAGFVSSVSEQKSPTATFPISFINFKNKNVKQKKRITKGEKKRYVEPVVAFCGPISPFMLTPKAKYPMKQESVTTSQNCSAIASKKSALSLFALMRGKVSFKRKIIKKEIMVENATGRFNTIYPLSYFLPSTFNPILSFKNQRVNAYQKWTKVGSFKETKNLASYLLRADWVLNKFIYQFSQLGKKNPRAIMNLLINDIRILIEKTGSECAIIGARITLTGRLGSRKKGMAQQISKCVGKVPLSTLRQKVDYSQGLLPTRLGLIGIKVWVCYK